MLDGVRGHPFLKSHTVLKGGTALNLFVLDVPRLSVDIDLNYIGAADRETMLADRPQVEQALQAVYGHIGLLTRRVPVNHAGGLDVERRLMPLLRAGAGPARADLAAWSAALVDVSRDLLSEVLPLRPDEREFLEHLYERGEIVPELLRGARRKRVKSGASGELPRPTVAVVRTPEPLG